MPAPAGPATAHPPRPAAPITDPAALKSAFLERVQVAKKFFYNTAVVQAQRIEVERRSHRARLPAAAEGGACAGRHPAGDAGNDRHRSRRPPHGRRHDRNRRRAAPARPARRRPGGSDRQSQLREQALSDKSVQAMLDVFGTEIKEVEET